MKKLLPLFIFSLIAANSLAQQLEWMKTISQPVYTGWWGDIEQTHYVVVDNDSNSVWAGDWRGPHSFDSTSQFSSGTFISKHSPGGNLLWSIHPPRTLNFSGLGTDKQGNIYISGEYYDSLQIGSKKVVSVATFDPNTGNRLSSYYFGKISPTGQCLWLKSYDAVNAGNRNFEYGYLFEMTTLGNGEVYLSGKVERYDLKIENSIISESAKPYGQAVDFVAKYNTNGQVEWINQYTGTNSSFNSLIPDNSNRVLMFSSNNPNLAVNTHDFIVMHKLNPAGHIDQSNSLNIHRKGGYFYYFFKKGTQNDFYIIGEFIDTVSFNSHKLVSTHVNALNALGDTIKRHRFNNFIVKYNLQGQVLWTKQIGSNDNMWLWSHGTDVDSDGNLYISGNFENELILDSIRLTGQAAAPNWEFREYKKTIFVTKLNSQGDVQWAQKAEGQHDEYNLPISTAYSPKGALYVAGIISNQPSWNGKAIPRTSDEHNIFLTKLQVQGLGPVKTVVSNPQSISAYPNPANETLTLEMPETEAEFVIINFYNTQGQRFQKEVLSTEGKTKLELAVENIPTGMYILQVQYGDKQEAKRIIIAR